MANHSFSVSVAAEEPGIPGTIFISPSTKTIVPGDTATFTVSSGSESVELVGYTSSGLSSTRPIGYFIAAGSSVVITVSNTGTKYVTFGAQGTTRIATLNSTSTPPPTPYPTPTAFSFPTVTGAARSTLIYSTTATITGINVPVNVSASNNAYISVDGGNYTAVEQSINNNQTIRVRQRSSGEYSGSVATTVYIKYGGVTKYATNWTVTSEPAPDINTYPQIPVGNLPIGMGDLINVFGKLGTDASIKDYYRGGPLVPNLTRNSNIPTSGTIALSSFQGSANAFYWIKEPELKVASASLPENKGQRIELYWDSPSNYKIGYSDQLADSLEYYVTATITNSAGADLAFIDIPNPGQYSVANQRFGGGLQMPNANEGPHSDGVINFTIYARAVGTTSPVITSTSAINYYVFGDPTETPA